MTARVVAFMRPSSGLEKEYQVEDNEYSEEEGEGMTKFKTLDASYPTHIQQESSTMTGGGHQSGR